MESKGVKAHFRMDESGVLTLESVESVFEGNRTENVTVKADEPDESTLKKIRDGFSSLFGGSADTEDKKEAEEVKEKSEEANEENKSENAKKTENLTSVITTLDVKKPTEENVEKSQKKLKDLADIDAYKLAREVALNKLETYIYEKKDKLYTEEYEEAMTEEERELITGKLNEASEWMEWLEEEVAPHVFDEKRKELKEVCRNWLLRVKTRKDVEQ